MKFLVGALIVSLIAVGLPEAGWAQVVTDQPTTTSSSGGSSSGSNANNITIGLLIVVVAVVFAVGWRSSHSSDSIVNANGPVSLYAMTDAGDSIAYDPDRVVSAGLAYTADF